MQAWQSSRMGLRTPKMWQRRKKDEVALRSTQQKLCCAPGVPTAGPTPELQGQGWHLGLLCCSFGDKKHEMGQKRVPTLGTQPAVTTRGGRAARGHLQRSPACTQRVLTHCCSCFWCSQGVSFYPADALLSSPQERGSTGNPARGHAALARADFPPVLISHGLFAACLL